MRDLFTSDTVVIRVGNAILWTMASAYMQRGCCRPTREYRPV